MKSKIFRLLKHGLLSALMLLIITTIVSFFSIYSEVKKACLTAKQEFSGNCQEALIQYIESENHTVREKNTAIWALGQLADPKSIEFLEWFHSANATAVSFLECNHDANFCGYEIQKAIKWSKNGNLTSWMYRNCERW